MKGWSSSRFLLSGAPSLGTRACPSVSASPRLGLTLGRRSLRELGKPTTGAKAGRLGGKIGCCMRVASGCVCKCVCMYGTRLVSVRDASRCVCRPAWCEFFSRKRRAPRAGHTMEGRVHPRSGGLAALRYMPYSARPLKKKSGPHMRCEYEDFELVICETDCAVVRGHGVVAAFVGTYSTPSHPPASPQEPWEAQEDAHRDRSGEQADRSGGRSPEPPKDKPNPNTSVHAPRRGACTDMFGIR